MSTRFREVHQNRLPQTEEPARASPASSAPRQRVLVLGRTLEPRCSDTWVGVKYRNTNRKERKRLVFDRLTARFQRSLTWLTGRRPRRCAQFFLGLQAISTRPALCSRCRNTLCCIYRDFVRHEPLSVLVAACRRSIAHPQPCGGGGFLLPMAAGRGSPQTRCRPRHRRRPGLSGTVYGLGGGCRSCGHTAHAPLWAALAHG